MSTTPDIVSDQCDRHARELGNEQRIEAAAEARYYDLAEDVPARAHALESAWIANADWDALDLLLFQRDAIALIAWIERHIVPQQHEQIRAQAKREARQQCRG